MRQTEPRRDRVRILISVLALALIPSTIASLLVLGRLESFLEDEARRSHIVRARARARRVEDFLRGVRQDLAYLADSSVIRALAAALDAGDADRLSRARALAERDLVGFTQGKRAYYQVRFLSRNGREQLRINVVEGRPRRVPGDELQDKSGRYYFREAMALEAGELYVSPMDLNIERGQPEPEARPVVRYAMAPAGAAGEPRGLTIINIQGEDLMALVIDRDARFRVWLVDEDGYVIGGSDPEDRARLRRGERRHLPEGVPLESSAWGGFVATRDAIYSAAAVRFAGDDRAWSLVLTRSRDEFEGAISRPLLLLKGLVLLLLGAAGLAGLFVARYLSTLTERLREAREQLAGWNRALEAEVESQTERMTRFQTDLARLDKLISLGQMSAGVLHEIGNPLASIKTRIQVAEEDGGCERCGPLLSEVIAEVDRLAGFLRSFGRLSRLPDARLRPEDPAALLERVAALLRPELRRRGLDLVLDLPPSCPAIAADCDQVIQLVMNLVLNAAEAEPKSGIIRARLRPMVGEGKVALEIEDDGAGIPAEVMARVWDPFYTTREDGTGLGLAICRRIADHHGGHISARSEPGSATIIRVELPQAGEEKIEPEHASDNPDPRG